MDLSIVIPCYNEVDNVGKIEAELFPVLAELARTRSVEVVFVDDGSKDGTYAAFTSAFGSGRDGILIRYEQHAVNRGLGAAIRTGLSAAHGDVVVTADSDGTYKFDTIPALLACLKDGVDIVTASPYHPDGEVVGVPAHRLILSQGSSLIYRVLVDWRIHCYTSLFRAYRRRVVEQVTFESNGFLGGTELMVKAMLQGFTVAEYPTKLYSRVFGTSKAKLARTIKAHLQFQGWVLAHRLHIRKLENIGKPVGGQRWA